jgi:PAS domain S-box-containing protein
MPVPPDSAKYDAEGAAPALRNHLLRYSAGILFAALGIAARLGLEVGLGLKLPYLTFFASSILAVWLGGLGPALLCVALSAAADWFWLPPAGSFAIADSAGTIGLGVYTFLSSAIVVLISAERKASRRARLASVELERALREPRTLLESLSETCYALDTDFRFTYLNRRAVEHFRRPRETLIGKTVWEAIPDKARTIFESSFREALARRQPVRFSSVSPVTLTPVEVQVQPTERGGLSILVRDTSERHAYEVGEQRMKEILRSATDAIITIDASEQITVFSAGAEQIFRCSAVDAVGQPIDRFIPQRFRRAHHGFIDEFGKTGVSSRQMGGERVLAALRSNGEEFPMEARISQSTAGVDKLYTVILRDVTERKRAEREREELLRRARDSAEEADRANRAKDDFLATVSHELRTPLTPILTWTNMLRTRTLDPETASRGIETIERAATAQAQLVEDLLDISRIVAGKMRLDVQRIPIAPVIEGAVESLITAAEAKGITMQVVLDPRSGLVSADPGRLQQVVWNLLSNAIKFTPKDGRVQVVLQRINSHVEIVVRDTGKGIARELLPYVFDRFRQDEATTTRAHRGLGLGLAISRHLVELHGGSVSCDSAGAGAGAVFTVRLPLAPLQHPPSRDEVHPRVDTGVALSLAPSLEGLRVLLVDDDIDTLEALAAVLTQAGAEVRTASSVAQAFEVLASGWQPVVIASDLGMPGEDGYALIRRLRELPAERGGRIPAVALTAYARVEDRLKVLSAGFQMHVPKPIEPAELAAVVASAAALEIKEL